MAVAIVAINVPKFLSVLQNYNHPVGYGNPFGGKGFNNSLKGYNKGKGKNKSKQASNTCYGWPFVDKLIPRKYGVRLFILLPAHLARKLCSLSRVTALMYEYMDDQTYTYIYIQLLSNSLLSQSNETLFVAKFAATRLSTVLIPTALSNVQSFSE